MENIAPRSGRLTRSQSKLTGNPVGNSVRVIKPETKENILKERNVTLLSNEMEAISLRETKKKRNRGLGVKEVKDESEGGQGPETEEVVGREREMRLLREMVEECVDGVGGGCVYVSGTPGTGKTCVVAAVARLMGARRGVGARWINCMELARPADVFKEALEALCGVREGSSARAADMIERVVCEGREKRSGALLLVLDEVDQLLGRDDAVLKRIIQWSQAADSRLIVIGIANSLDLIERQFPELLLSSNRPRVIHFPPYTEPEIASIIRARVTQDNSAWETKLSPPERAQLLAAITFCSKKISSQSGDARKALNLFKRAQELSELDEVHCLRSESVDRGQSPPRDSTPLKRVLSTPQMIARHLSVRRPDVTSSPSIKHVNRAILLAERTANPFHSIIDSESGRNSLPLHQKLLLCAALVLSSGGPRQRKPIRLGPLHDKYCEVCQSQSIEPIDMGNFTDIAVHLESRGLVSVQPHRESRQRLVQLYSDTSGIEKALDDRALLTAIMDRFMSPSQNH